MLTSSVALWSRCAPITAHLTLLAVAGVLCGIARADDSYIISKTPQANTGLVLVYLSTEGKLIQTTQFTPEDYKLVKDGKQVVEQVVVTINPVVPGTSKKRLEEQLTDKGIGPGRVGKIIPLNPSKIEVELLPPGGGNAVGKFSVEGDGVVLFDQDKTFPITIDVTGKGLKEAQIKNCTLQVTQTYSNVKTAKAKFASAAQVRGRLTATLEAVTGSAKADISAAGTSYVERQVLQQMIQDAKSKSFFLSINADPEMVKLVEDKVTAELEKLQVQTPPGKEPYFVYLADLGRLDVKPKQVTLEDHETATKTAMEDRLKLHLMDLVKIAKDVGTLEEFRERVIRHTDTNGAGGLKAIIPAEVPIPFEASADGQHVSDKDGTTEQKKARWESFRKHLESVTDVEKDAKASAERHWKGRNSIVDNGAKSLNFVATSKIEGVLNAYAEALRFETGKGATELKIPYIPFRMDALVPHAEAYRLIKKTFAVKINPDDKENAMTIIRLGIDGSENPPAEKEAGAALQFNPLLDESTAPFRSFVAAREGVTELRLYNYANPADQYDDKKQYLRARTPELKDFANCGFESFNFQRLDLNDTQKVINDLLGVIDTTAVTKLTFADCELPAGWRRAIKLDAEHFPNLTHLQIARNVIVARGGGVSKWSLDDTDLQEIAKLPHLTHLTLGRETQLTDKGFAPLVDAPSLRQFTIVDPEEDNKGFPTKASLVPMLKANPKLMFTLKIWKNCPATQGDKGQERRLKAIMIDLTPDYGRQLTTVVDRDKK